MAFLGRQLKEALEACIHPVYSEPLEVFEALLQSSSLPLAVCVGAVCECAQRVWSCVGGACNVISNLYGLNGG